MFDYQRVILNELGLVSGISCLSENRGKASTPDGFKLSHEKGSFEASSNLRANPCVRLAISNHIWLFAGDIHQIPMISP